MTFYKKLASSWRKSNSLLCIGLDSEKGFSFHKKIIDQTHDLVCAYKPNSAFYEAKGPQGIPELKKTFDYIRTKYPGIVTILDAKRGDIANTNEEYATFIFDYLEADAVTLSPYLGREAMQPFISRKEKGSIILCRTSNPGAGEFQDGLYKKVAEHVVKFWNSNNNCALVVGATCPDELKIVRRIVGDMPLLIPGIGAQGANVEKTVRAGQNSHGAGMIITVSRAIIFSKNPRAEAMKIRDDINKQRKYG